MIERVRGDWIKGVLEKSLHQVARLELGLTVDQTAVARGLDVVVQRPDEEPERLPAATAAVDIFDDHRGQLLILGAPGIRQDDDAAGADARLAGPGREG